MIPPPFNPEMMHQDLFQNGNVGTLDPPNYGPYFPNSNMYNHLNPFNQYHNFPMTPTQMYQNYDSNQFHFKNSEPIHPHIQTPTSKSYSHFSGENSESSIDNLEENKLLEPLLLNNFQNPIHDRNLYVRNNSQEHLENHKNSNSFDKFGHRSDLYYNPDPYFKIVHKEPKPYEKEIEIKERERREIVFQEVEMEIEIPQPPITKFKEEFIDKEVWISQPPKKVKVREIVEKELLVDQPPIKKFIKEKVKVPISIEQPNLKKKVLKRIPREIIYKYPTQRIKLIKEVRPYNPVGDENKKEKEFPQTDPERKVNIEFSSIPDEREPESENMHLQSLNSTPDNADFII